ncbi:gamma-glutamylcyclotransferase [Rhizobium ruizarguesonis]|uniref:gamma-glutamylcyclotransferase family protein n=1 Tax=Rhizobium ruizarguesonis TaxID=2081791 RepID=UPI001639DC9B|nr:gamma-glutamylcyclotransferase family protein [Rhizobium ruizarguesonis]MBC2805974.1 gamma-glutamylcyclotransferase [Rhizobium ruizarguesonis]
MEDPVIYFAYGSNMCTARLLYRVPGAAIVGSATLEGHRLRFHKRGKDKSGKCNADFTGSADDRVLGVLFTVPAAELGKLHSAEGRGYGYDDHSLEVQMADGATVKALTYLAATTHIDDSLAPYGWYWDFVDAGAREHGLPAMYREAHIDSVQHHPDPDAQRDRDERAKVRTL